MVFEYRQAYALFTWLAIYLPETYSMTRADVEWYTQERDKRLPSMLRVPSMVFPVVWFILKGLLIASHFFYFEYAFDFTYWTFVAVFVTTFINIVLMKTWTMLFFGVRRIGAALAVAVGLVITSILVTIFMGLSQPALGDMYWLPLILYVLYPAWLIFALVLNAAWYTGGWEGGKRQRRVNV